jgi:MarR-like DNA-binding transcriptional regulator SgrR of sgrS sRNA
MLQLIIMEHTLSTEIGDITIEKLTKQDWNELNTIIDEYLKDKIAYNEREAAMMALIKWSEILIEIFDTRREADTPVH